MSSSKLLQKAISSLVSASALLAASGCDHTGAAKKLEQMPSDKDAMGKCSGINGCKGKGACGGKGHACAGKNTCKGQGWEKLSKSACEAKGGKFEGL